MFSKIMAKLTTVSLKQPAIVFVLAIDCPRGENFKRLDSEKTTIDNNKSAIHALDQFGVLFLPLLQKLQLIYTSNQIGNRIIITTQGIALINGGQFTLYQPN